MTQKKILLKTKNCKKKAVAGAIIAASALLAVNGYTYTQEQHVKLIQQQQEADELKEHINDLNNHIDSLNNKINQMEKEKVESEKQIKSLKHAAQSASNNSTQHHGGISVSKNAMNVEVTAYDLSEASCGKAPGQRGYGVTATGFNLSGHTLESARAIAVDPRIIPLGSRVKIKFTDNDMQKYNGIYTAVDTGSAIKGNRIDIFAGDGARNVAMHIGRRAAKLELV